MRDVRLRVARAIGSMIAAALVFAAPAVGAAGDEPAPGRLHPALAGIDWSTATEIVIDLQDHNYAPDEIQLKRGRPYKLILKNVGRVAHDMVGGTLFEESVIALRMVNSDAGRVVADYVNSVYVRSRYRIELWLVPIREGEYSFYCSLPGHRDDGMEGTVRIVP